jgi:hypothetical protein
MTGIIDVERRRHRLSITMAQFATAIKPPIPIRTYATAFMQNGEPIRV